MLPPKPGGLLAALDAAPDAGVIFVAHTGLDRMIDGRRRLAGAADGQATIRCGSGACPPEDVPTGEEERIDWLYDWWARIDAWIEERQAEAGLPTPR